MSKDFKRLLDKYRLQLAYLPIISKGYLIHRQGKKDLICVKQGLTHDEAKQVILHEIGHCKRDNNVVGNYSVSYVTRVRCEHEAEKYMIGELIREHANIDYDVSRLNYVDLAKSLGVNNYLQVRRELSKYKVNK